MHYQTTIKSHATRAQVQAVAGHERLLLDVVGVMALTGLSRAKIYEGAACGAFPKAKKVGPRMARWDRRDVMAWIDRLPKPAPERAALLANVADRMAERAALELTVTPPTK